MGQRVRRLSLGSFAGLVLLSAALAGLLHWASPLRDPSFEVNSANAGTQVPWLKGVPETAWLQASFALAALLAANLTWVLWQWSQAPQRSGFRGATRWVAIAAVLFLALGFSSTVVVLNRFSYGPINPIVMATLIALTVLLTAHFVGMVWFWQRTKTMLAQLSEPASSLQRWGRIYTSVYWVGFAACLFTALQILFLGYLFAQHMID